MAHDRPLFADLFSGAGGASHGIRLAGGRVVQTVEQDATAVMTHSMNHPPTRHFWSMADAVGRLDALYWWASPPCQPFSASGKRLGARDPRNQAPTLLEALKVARHQGRLPRTLWVENVVGLTQHLKWVRCTLEEPRPDVCPGCYFQEEFLRGLRRFFAHVDWYIVNAADYGVPQTRRRVIVQASQDPVPKRPPPPSHSQASLVRRKLDQGLGLSRAERAAWKRRTPEKLSLVPWVTASQALGRTVWLRHRQKGARTRVEAPSPTVSTKGTLYDHPPGGLRRRVDPSEAATLQGFPGYYAFAGNSTQRHKQVGNAMPPALAVAVICHGLRVDKPSR